MIVDSFVHCVWSVDCPVVESCLTVGTVVVSVVSDGSLWVAVLLLMLVWSDSMSCSIGSRDVPVLYTYLVIEAVCGKFVFDSPSYAVVWSGACFVDRTATEDSTVGACVV